MSESVVILTEPHPGIAQITMQDRENKNTFTEALIEGMFSVYARIQNNPNYKAVIVTGYDTYFASGGTQEWLLSLQAGQIKFTDIGIFKLALECPIPVISAMQGHGIGGGFITGLYSDMLVLSRESIYTANFMKYGFTPGMGATLILPYKFGSSLGTEMLFTAETYRGEDLKQRGVPFPVVPRMEVLDKAMEMAMLLSEKPRTSLVTLKNHLTKSLRAQLPSVIEEELRMHEMTVHQPEVRSMIEQSFIKKY